jgi:secondary thiamine-phosphate synthase enzyme
MPAHSGRIEVETRGKGLYPFTRDVQRWLRDVCAQQALEGLLTIFVQHTSASLTLQENADPDVVLDIADFFERLVPENDPHYRHVMEGPDDMPSHIRAALTQTSLSIPIIGGHMALGTWQGIYLFEHRASSMRRSVVLQLLT